MAIISEAPVNDELDPEKVPGNSPCGPLPADRCLPQKFHNGPTARLGNRCLRKSKKLQRHRVRPAISIIIIIIIITTIITIIITIIVQVFWQWIGCVRLVLLLFMLS